MDKKAIKNKVAKYFSENMDASEKKEMEKKFRTSTLYKEEYEAYLLLEQAFENSLKNVPSDHLSQAFFKNLEELIDRERETKQETDKKIIRKTVPEYMKWAGGIALFVLGYGFSQMGFTFQSGLSKEIASLREEIQETKTSLLFAQIKTPSTSDRIKAVRLSYDLTDVNEAIIEELANLLKTDPSTNVRLTAANALFLHHHHVKVQMALVTALGHQEDITLKITLINMIGAFDLEMARNAMKSLLEQGEFPSELREELQENLRRL